jgi:spermidine synthase
MTMDLRDVRRGGAALALATASGFAGLGYQIVWTQQGALWLGHEAAAVLAVVAAFFGGMALGALCFGRAVHATAVPLRWYVTCELVIAAWAVLLAVFFRPASAALLMLIGPEPAPAWHWSIAFAGTFLLLLPATAAMGLTLPALERLVPASRGHSRFGGLYAANTGGAVLGVLATAFWLVPSAGLKLTALSAGAANLLCALAAAAVFRGAPQGAAAFRAAVVADHTNKRGALLRLAATGLLGIGYEVVAVRVLSQVTEETVYTFAAALAVYLAGTAAGAAVYQRWWAGRQDRHRTGTSLLVALCVATLLGAAALWSADALRIALGAALGSSLPAAMGIEAALALSAFALPTFVMGALFSHLCNAANAAGAGFGAATGWNCIGAAIAPALFGVLAVPMFGPKWSLLLVSAGYLALLPWRAWMRPLLLLPVAGVAAIALVAPPLAFVDVPDGGRILSYRDGVTAAVSVVEDGEGVVRLRIDNRQQEGSNSSFAFDARQAWLPLLLHPAPRRALFLGMGTGVTAAAATRDPTIEVDVVELLPEVIAASESFTDVFAGPARNPAVRVIAADARRYTRASDAQYDVIVSDNFHPARSGAGSLYTVEHFQAVRRRLAAGGVFCQWLPLHQLDLDSLRSAVGAFLVAFPRGTAILANNSLETPVIGLVGRAEDKGFDGAALQARRQRISAGIDLAALGLEDEYAILGSFVAGPSVLKRFASSARVNTDDLPVVAYHAPRITYAPDSTPAERLLQLLDAWHVEPAEVLDASAPADLAGRLASYWQARRAYIEAGRDVRPTADVRQMLAQVREPLLSVLRISPDFRPARQPLLLMARALAATDPAGARALLEELQRIGPDDAQLRDLLDGLPH